MRASHLAGCHCKHHQSGGFWRDARAFDRAVKHAARRLGGIEFTMSLFAALGLPSERFLIQAKFGIIGDAIGATQGSTVMGR
jgi:hypothetical protein